jgi:hypothetical protein
MGTHTNTTTQQQEMICITGEIITKTKQKTELKGTSTFWTSIYKGALAVANQ